MILGPSLEVSFDDFPVLTIRIDLVNQFQILFESPLILLDFRPKIVEVVLLDLFQSPFWKIFADLLPILAVVLHKLDQESVVFLFPALFCVVFQPPVATVAHLGIPSRH